MRYLTISLNGKPAEIAENGIVDAAGHEISWQEYLDGEVECLPEECPIPLVSICSENGYGACGVSTYLLGESIVVRHSREYDLTNVLIGTGGNDPIAVALDGAVNNLRALAVSVLGPLLDDDPDLVTPTFQRTPWTDDMGGNASEDPMLYWTSGALLDPRVKRPLRERLAAGAYPQIAETQQVGSGSWRLWGRSLLTPVPPGTVEHGAPRDGYPLYGEDVVIGMSDGELSTASRQAFFRQGMCGL